MNQKFMVVIHPEKTLRIYYDHWWQNVTDGPTVTKWVVASRQRFCNALAIEHKCNTSLPNEAYNYKREDNKNPRYPQLHTNTLRNHFVLIFSLESFSLTDLSIRGGLVDTTLAFYSSTQFILQVSHLQRWPHSQNRPSATTRNSIVDFSASSNIKWWTSKNLIYLSHEYKFHQEPHVRTYIYLVPLDTHI